MTDPPAAIHRKQPDFSSDLSESPTTSERPLTGRATVTPGQLPGGPTWEHESPMPDGIGVFVLHASAPTKKEYSYE